MHLLGSIVLQSLPPEKKRSWPEHLGDLVFAYNTTPHSRTGFSPFFLMFRREIRLPFDNLLGDTDPDQESSPDNWVTLHQQRLQDAYHHVKRRLAQAAHYRKMVHDSKAKVMDSQIGDRVYLRQHVLGRNKIQDAYGPKVYKVIQRRGSQDIYEIEPVDGLGVSKWVNRGQLRLCPRMVLQNEAAKEDTVLTPSVSLDKENLLQDEEDT